MARTWTIFESGCSSVYLLGNDKISVETTWHEISPTQAATLPNGTKMLDANGKELTLLDGYCTTYFYKGWQTTSPMLNGKIGKIITNEGFGNNYGITPQVGPTVANVFRNISGLGDRKLQIVRLPDSKITLPNNVGQNLISDLYPGVMWGNKMSGSHGRNWYDQWNITPLAPDNCSISDQLTDMPRSFTIDETNIPGYGTDTNNEFYAPELFAPYMYLRNQEPKDGIYVGGIIVVIGVKKLSSGAKSIFFDEEAESDSTEIQQAEAESDSTEIQQADELNDNVEDKELS